MVAPDIRHASGTASNEKTETRGFRIEKCSLESIGTHKEEVEDGVFMMDDVGQGKGEDVGHGERTKLDIDIVSTAEVERVALVVSPLLKEDGSRLDVSGGESTPMDQEGGICDSKLTGIKRPSIGDEPSVCIRYNLLPRSSKRKLEELLQQWSDWHAKNCSSAKDPFDALECGEETHFPALNVGSDNKSTVAFWMDNEVCKRQRKDDSAPLYDRGYAFGLTSDDGPVDERRIVPDLREVGRCFNCGSYSHSLNKCTKPHDANAVKSARKQFQSKKGSAGPSIPKRYYQDAPEGKYSGLKPGTLSAETRELLGLGELDPPPWLNKMRELGYPPGYLEAEHQTSGIEIFGDEEAGDGGKSPQPTTPACKKEKTVDFPGINAPVPENADPKRWEPPQVPPVSDFSSKFSEKRASYGEQLQLRKIADSPSPYFGSGYASSPATPSFHYNSYVRDHSSYNGHFSSRGIPSPDYGRYRPEPMRRSFHEDAIRGVPILSPDYGRYPHEPVRTPFHEDAQRIGMPIPSPNYGRYTSEPMRPPFLHEHSPIDPVYPNALHSPPSHGYSYPGRRLQ